MLQASHVLVERFETSLDVRFPGKLLLFVQQIEHVPDSLNAGVEEEVRQKAVSDLRGSSFSKCRCRWPSATIAPVFLTFILEAELYRSHERVEPAENPVDQMEVFIGVHISDRLEKTPRTGLGLYREKVRWFLVGHRSALLVLVSLNCAVLLSA